MLKKLLVILLCISLIYSTGYVVKAETTQYSGKCGDNAYWKIENDVMTISGTGAVTLSPWKNYFHKWEIQPKQLIIESGITSISDNSFHGEYNQEDLFKNGISLPDTLKYIGKYAFDTTNCTTIVLPSSVEEIDNYAFCDNRNLEQVVINSGIKKMGIMLFEGCYNLKKVTIQGTLESLGEETFLNCWSLEEIQLPSSLKELGKRAFYRCGSLKEITIPEGVKTIPEQTFMRCTGLEKVTLPSSLETIEKEAFVNCNHMTTCALPSSLTSIGEGAFSYCSSLKSVTVPESVTTLGKNAFKDCYDLQNIQLPSAMQEFPEGLLSGCASLQSFTFPEHIKSIGKKSLEGCNSLKKIVIPSEVTSLETFDQDCSQLKKIVNQSKVAYSLKSSKLVKTWYQGKKKVTKVAAGKTVTSKNKSFKITYRTKISGMKVQIKGKLKKTYKYGESVKLPKTVNVNDSKTWQNFFVGWEYNVKNKKYKTGRPRTYYNSLVSKTDNGTKGDVTVSPVIIGVYAKRNNKNQLVVRLREHTSLKMFANAYQLNCENIDEYYGASQFFFEARYATNASMKNAVNVGRLQRDECANTITEMEKGKTYYLQIRPVGYYHAGVAYESNWSDVVKLKVK